MLAIYAHAPSYLLMVLLFMLTGHPICSWYCYLCSRAICFAHSAAIYAHAPSVLLMTLLFLIMRHLFCSWYCYFCSCAICFAHSTIIFARSPSNMLMATVLLLTAKNSQSDDQMVRYRKYGICRKWAYKCYV